MTYGGYGSGGHDRDRIDPHDATLPRGFRGSPPVRPDTPTMPRGSPRPPRPQPQTPPDPPPAPKLPERLPPAVSAGRLATLSLVFALVFAPAGAVFGHLARSAIKHRSQPGRVRAALGLTLSYGLIVIVVVLLVVWLVAGPKRNDDDSVPSTTPTSKATVGAYAPLPEDPVQQSKRRQQQISRRAGGCVIASSQDMNGLRNLIILRR